MCVFLCVGVSVCGRRPSSLTLGRSSWRFATSDAPRLGIIVVPTVRDVAIVNLIDLRFYDILWDVITFRLIDYNVLIDSAK